MRAFALARLPTLCAVCRSWSSEAVCTPCLARFAPPVPRCGQCGLRLARPAPRCGACLQRRDAPVDETVVALDYAFPWNGLITEMKFHSRSELAGLLAERLAQMLRGSTSAADLVVPVPLSSARLRERGFNQAWELARRVARAQRLAARHDLLLRVRDTAHQLGLTQRERARNLRGAFLVAPALRSLVAGRRVALVDDVLTTGATVDEAARTLRAAGAAAVLVWAVARTPAPEDDSGTNAGCSTSSSSTPKSRPTPET